MRGGSNSLLAAPTSTAIAYQVLLPGCTSTPKLKVPWIRVWGEDENDGQFGASGRRGVVAWGKKAKQTEEASLWSVRGSAGISNRFVPFFVVVVPSYLTKNASML